MSLSVQGIIGSESPVVTQMARQVARDASGVWAVARRVYRFLGNTRFSTAQLTQGLYACPVQTVRAAAPAYVVVALTQ